MLRSHRRRHLQACQRFVAKIKSVRLRVPPCCVRATSDPPHFRATLPGFLGRPRPCSPSPMRPNCTPRTKENRHAPPGLLLVPMLTERNQPARKHGLAFVEQPDSSRSCPDADVQRQLSTPPSSPKVSLSVFFSWAAAPGITARNKVVIPCDTWRDVFDL